MMASTSMADELGTKLAADGLGLTVSTNLFEHHQPDEPDDCITLYERPGRDPVRTSANTVVSEQPALYVLARGVDCEATRALLVKIKDKLQNFKGALGSSTYLQITARGAISGLGVDDRQRFQFGLYFAVMRKES